MNDFVEKEANIWAWIYRGINRKKDNNEYDEEDEDEFLHLNTMMGESSNLFEEGFNRLSSMEIPNNFKLRTPLFEGTHQIEEIKEEKEEDKEDDSSLTDYDNPSSNEDESPKLSKSKTKEANLVPPKCFKDGHRLTIKMKRISTELGEVPNIKSIAKSISSSMAVNNTLHKHFENIKFLIKI